MVNTGLDSELSTMHDIAAALGELDPPARARVLHWLEERFHGEASPVHPAAIAPASPAVNPLRAVPPPVSDSDEALSVETLEDLFDPRGQAAPAAREPQPITGMLREFVAEFQDIAREWDGARDAPADARRPTRHLSAVS